jgi:hypothetical protein
MCPILKSAVVIPPDESANLLFCLQVYIPVPTNVQERADTSSLYPPDKQQPSWLTIASALTDGPDNALIAQVDRPEKHMSGNPTNQDFEYLLAIFEARETFDWCLTD